MPPYSIQEFPSSHTLHGCSVHLPAPFYLQKSRAASCTNAQKDSWDPGKKKQNLCGFVSALPVRMLGKRCKWQVKRGLQRSTIFYYRKQPIWEKQQKPQETKESHVAFDSYPNEVIVASPSNHCFVDFLGYVIFICHQRSYLESYIPLKALNLIMQNSGIMCDVQQPSHLENWLSPL